MSTQLEQRCAACGGEEVERRIGVNDVRVCTRCGMGRIPGEPMRHSYWTLDDPQKVLDDSYWSARRKMFRAALEGLQLGGGAGRVLDLGGGAGHFTEIALQLGWDAYSMDLSEAAVAAAATRIGPERSLGPGQAAEMAGSFDAVTLWCVVAHVADPAALLEEAAGYLRPGGRMLLTTPNFLFQNLYARILARAGRPLDFSSQDHLLNFTPRALELLASRAGLSGFSFHYFGVTEECLLDRRRGRVLVPLKKAWNWFGARTTALGLPPLGAELHFLATRP
ncbi:MAG TPA: class I SAM-dependent methyltransferase [Actinomycetota bacterium]|nr:class I SAM-dependent methyltransferase [Actinomycetota bacterium]